MEETNVNNSDQQQLISNQPPMVNQKQDQPADQYNGYQQPMYNQQPQYNQQYQQQPQYAAQPYQQQPQYAQQPYPAQNQPQYYQGQPQPQPPAYGQQQVVVTQQVQVQSKKQGGQSAALPGMHFEDPGDRLGFIRKVYLILTAQLAFTAGFVAYTMSTPTIQAWIYDNWWMYFPVIIVMIFTEVALICNRKLARTVPINYIFLFLFTCCETYFVALICSNYDATDVIFATAVTAGMVIGLTVYAFKTKTDFTVLGGLLWIISFSLFMMMWFWIFLPVSSLMYQFLCVLVVCLFGVYLVYDTQLVVGKGKYKLQIDDYILGAMILYADIITIFIYILALFGNR